MNISQENLKEKKGFTILELIISIGLFVTVVFISMGAMVNLFDANNKSHTIFSAVNNLNYAVESMTRTIRFGTNYHCGGSLPYTTPIDCASGSNFIAVTNPSGQVVIYRLTGTRIGRSDNGGSTYRWVTGLDVRITYARFYVLNTAPATSPFGTPGRDNQPYVVIVMRGYAGADPVSQTIFDLETLVSQKVLDL